jgi:type II secretory pathway component GspD/PulD (secretin)
VVAVADDQSNSLIVSATAETLEQVSQIIAKIDQSTTDITDTRIFRLQHADSSEMAEIINGLYVDTTSQNAQNRNRGQRGFGGQGFGQQGGGGGGQQQSQRALIQSKVIAVGDPRTNSLLVTAARETMAEIAEMVGRLDATDAKKQRVYVYSLQHADPDSVATVLRGMLGDESANNSAQQTGAARLTERSAQGAQMDTSAFQNSGRGGGGGGGGGR